MVDNLQICCAPCRSDATCQNVRSSRETILVFPSVSDNLDNPLAIPDYCHEQSPTTSTPPPSKSAHHCSPPQYSASYSAPPAPSGQPSCHQTSAENADKTPASTDTTHHSADRTATPYKPPPSAAHSSSHPYNVESYYCPYIIKVGISSVPSCYFLS